MSDVLDQEATDRWTRVRAPLLTIAGLSAATVALHYRDPHEQGSWGVCPTALMGFACPGCGGLRAVNELTNGDLAAAASSNLLLVLLAPLAVALLITWTWRRWREEPMPTLTSRYAGYGLLVATGLFTLLRNTPAAPWLAP